MIECKDTGLITLGEENKYDRLTFKLLAIASNVESCGLPLSVRDRL